MFGLLVYASASLRACARAHTRVCLLRCLADHSAQPALSSALPALKTGDPIIAERGFELVVLDEATQAPEPAALVAVAARVSAAYCAVAAPGLLSSAHAESNGLETAGCQHHQ